MAITGEDLRTLPGHLPDWIREHLELYVGSGGREGHEWRGVTTLLLKTVGRRSGKPLLLPLIYGLDPEHPGERFVLVASKGGAPAHPAWYLNLAAEPRVEIQVGPKQYAAHAETVSGEERARLWRLMAAIWPDYDNYRRATDREIPVVALSTR